MPRELFDTGTERFVRRNESGQFRENVDVGQSLAADQRHNANKKAKPANGDRGDR